MSQWIKEMIQVYGSLDMDPFAGIQDLHMDKVSSAQYQDFHGGFGRETQRIEVFQENLEELPP